jgi:hypothetical protein
MNSLRIIKLLVFVLIAATMATASASAGTVLLTWPATHGADGEFLLTPSGTGGLGTTPFLSFCIETNEYINPYSPGTSYWYSLGPSAIQGGTGGPHPDPISIGTAWLYNRFSLGLLGTLTVDQQNDLQGAFWFLEQETAPTVSGVNFHSSATNYYVSLAQTALGISTDLKGDANGAYGVVVVNLWKDAAMTLPAQSMLGRVPDGGLTIMLLGIGIGGLSLLSRKLRS